MASMATLKLNHNFNVSRTILPNSSKIHPSPSFNIASWPSSNKYVLSNFHQRFHQQQEYNVIQCQVASLDVSEVSDENDPATEAIEVVGEIGDLIGHIKALLSTMDDGRISVSPYDTAWVALIKDVNGRDCPQFPSALDWIAQHQLADGSWGDEHFVCAYDSLVNTLACIVALRFWKVHPTKCEKGILYVKENVHKLENASAEHMTCGFEVVFPALLQRAKKLGIDDLPYDSPVIAGIQNARDKKMKKIPKEVMHKVPTSLLFSLEGLEDLDWQKLLKLQSVDGSFLTSPSSTAFAFMETGDQNCLRFITNTVQKLNGGAPHTYPVDVFARLWAVDRLQRLGISRYFGSEIKEILSYISRYWTKKGLFSGRDSEFCDIDDTSMAFRLLRMHGYDIDPSVLENFRNGDKFSCYGGQMIESSSPIYNLFRASQLQFPGEKVLEDARDFAYNFLQEKLAINQLLDKWVISEHLPDEIRTGLEMPYYASLPRVEARYYLQHYSGGKDVWIGKTLYRMEEISNNKYLELSRLDFQRCQEQHQIEWSSLQQWYAEGNVQEFGITRKDLLVAYFLSAATMFEPDRTKERFTWAKSQIICRMIKSFFSEGTAPIEKKTWFLKEILRSSTNLKKSKSDTMGQGLENILLATLRQFLDDYKQPKNAWSEWLMKLQHGGASFWEDATLLVTALLSCGGGDTFNEDILSHDEFKTLSHLLNKICQQLSQIHNKKASDMEEWRAAKANMRGMEIEQDMQALIKLVLEESGGIDRNIKQTFLSVVKTHYYCAYNAAETIDIHIFRVLLDPVVGSQFMALSEEKKMLV